MLAQLPEFQQTGAIDDRSFEQNRANAPQEGQKVAAARGREQLLIDLLLGKHSQACLKRAEI